MWTGSFGMFSLLRALRSVCVLFHHFLSALVEYGTQVRRLIQVIQHRYEIVSKDNREVRFGTSLRLVRVLLSNTAQFQASWFLLHFQNQEGF